MYMKSLRCFFCLLCLVISSMNAQGADVPRLWEVKARTVDGKPATFHILAVSHNGLDVEYNAYLKRKVLPIFKHATVYSYEDNTHMTWDTVPNCEKPLSDFGYSAAVQAARDKLIAGYLLHEKISTEYFPPKTDAEFAELQRTQSLHYSKYVSQASELALLFLTAGNTKSIAGVRRIHAAMAKGEDAQPYKSRPQISHYLGHRRPHLRVALIDTNAEIVSAYCSLDVAKRAVLFQAWLDTYDYDKVIVPLNLSGPANADFANSISQNRIVGDWDATMPGSVEGFICGRNKNWTQKIARDLGHGQRFYALGLAHLLANSTCPDLLTMLRQEGMTVTLIE